MMSNFDLLASKLRASLRTILILGLTSVVICSIAASASADQSTLGPGDIVFLQGSTDTATLDVFAFSPLVDIEAGTVIHFTDEGRVNTNPSTLADFRLTGSNGTGSLGEASYTWVAPSNIAAGTVVSINETVHVLGLSTSGDNLLAFQGTIYRPNFVAGLGWAITDSFITTGVASSNNSYLPSSLTLGTDAVEMTSNLDNTGYTGTTSGTAGTLRTAVNTAANWTTNDTAAVAPPGSLTVTGAAAAADAVTVVGGYSFGVNLATYSQNPTAEPTPNLDLAALTTVNLTGTADVDGGNGFNAQDYQTAGGWSTAVTPNVLTDQALQFTATIASGMQFDLTHISYTAQTVASGVDNLAIYVSTDGFATSSQLGSNLVLSGTTWGVSDFTDVASTQYTGTMTFRIFGFSATTGAENLEIDEIWLDGQLSLIPEPGTFVMMLIGGLAVWMFRGDRGRKA